MYSYSAYTETKEDKLKYTFGTSIHSSNARYLKPEYQSILFTELNYNQTNLFLEKRKERYLSSVEYKNSFLYFSAGHRYKPFSGFLFLRDPEFYSAFQYQPNKIIPHPLKLSSFVGTYLYKWSVGALLGRNFAEKKAAFYIQAPNDSLALAYSPETKQTYLRVHYQYKNLNLPNLLIYSEMQGDKKNNSGYLNLKSNYAPYRLDLNYMGYKEDKKNPLNETIEVDPATVQYTTLSWDRYYRIEYFDSRNLEQFHRIGGGNLVLFYGKYGAICTGLRYYSDHKYNAEEKFYLEKQTLGYSASYEYIVQSTKFILRFEQRKNKDRLAELRLSFAPIRSFKLDIASLFQAESNQFLSIYEKWIDGIGNNSLLSNKVANLKIRMSTENLVLNLSSYRTTNGKGEIISMNFQYKISF